MVQQHEQQDEAIDVRQEIGSMSAPSTPNVTQKMKKKKMKMTQKEKLSNSSSRRTSRGQLSKRQEIDHVVVEDTFAFHVRNRSSEDNNDDDDDDNDGDNAIDNSNNNINSSEKVGEGCYISTTIQNRKYYGLLFDENTIKVASSLQLLQQQEQEEEEQQSDKNNSDSCTDINSMEFYEKVQQLYQEHKQQQKMEEVATNDSTNNEVNDIDVTANNDSVRTATADMMTTDDNNSNSHHNNNKRLRPDIEVELESKQRSHNVVASAVAISTEEEDVIPAKRLRLVDDQAIVGKDAGVLENTKPTSSCSIGAVALDVSGSNKRMKSNVQQQNRAIQKFSYVIPPTAATSTSTDVCNIDGYPMLLATYVNSRIAATDNYHDRDNNLQQRQEQLQKQIEYACDMGGNFVHQYYYQYEPQRQQQEQKQKQHQSFLYVPDAVVEPVSSSSASFRTSMGLHTFLQTTYLPSWFPLSNLKVGQQQKVLSLLNQKKKETNMSSPKSSDRSALLKHQQHQRHPTTMSIPKLIPMESPRTRYRICVIGGGIAGLSCCCELFRICDREKIDIEITLVEGRDRLGGRIQTDYFKYESNSTTNVPIEMGASWIHGIQSNPLANLAKEAGAQFVTTSEDVKILLADMQEMDPKKDFESGKLFDELLDLAAHDCWTKDETSTCIENPNKHQSTVRWYSSNSKNNNNNKNKQQKRIVPLKQSPPPHRVSSDVSVDVAVGEAIAKHKRKEYALLSEEERNMLIWNTKNVEYALGANIKDLSMKFWDIDERHAFEGDHVMIRQGYSTIIDYMYRMLRRRGNRFTALLDFPVGKVEYSRLTTTQPYTSSHPRNRKFVDLSDTCSVTSVDGKQIVKSDFIVSAVPLGVLKASVQDGTDESKILFHPPLPYTKIDAVKAVGFGLLNKVFLEFPYDFWQLKPDQTQFGNASGINPHLYMFLDVGKALFKHSKKKPAILMTLISGREAVTCEVMSETEFIAQIMETLRILFRTTNIPDPIAYKVSRWGSDRFARGSYTFLGPGSTDEDFETLQSPINGNGDLRLLEASNAETMRLFFAGEHTTALFPSMAHGAMLSGNRAAKEITEAMIIPLNSNGDDNDIVVPTSYFRFLHPNRELRCNLCHNLGTTLSEGKLLAFKKGSRYIICHSNCAEYSPEVEILEEKWKGVIDTYDKSRYIKCASCGKYGATMACTEQSCSQSYHFPCAIKHHWKSDSGIPFLCPIHNMAGASTASTVGLGIAPPKAIGDTTSVVNKNENNAYTDSSGESENEVIPIAPPEKRKPQPLSIDIPLGVLQSKNYKPNESSFIWRLGRISRETIRDQWNVEFDATCMDNSPARLLIIAATKPDPFDQFEEGDVVKSVNGIRIGSDNMNTLQKFFTFINQEVEVMLEVRRLATSSTPWY